MYTYSTNSISSLEEHTELDDLHLSPQLRRRMHDRMVGLTSYDRDKLINGIRNNLRIIAKESYRYGKGRTLVYDYLNKSYQDYLFDSVFNISKIEEFVKTFRHKLNVDDFLAYIHLSLDDVPETKYSYKPLKERYEKLNATDEKEYDELLAKMMDEVLQVLELQYRPIATSTDEQLEQLKQYF